MSLPSNREQELLYLVNRFRADPLGEAARITKGTGMPEQEFGTILFTMFGFHVDTALFAQQLAALSPAPPLAWNSTLEQAAAGHSAAMIAANTQAHQVAGEADLGGRLGAVGYGFQAAAENIYAYASSVNFAHAGFVVDWGGGTGGMQTPPGHRNALISTSYAEIGIDVTEDNDTGNAVGPLVVTQDLGRPFGYAAQFLGAVFADADSDGGYDAGEGLAGVTVKVSGVGGSFTTTTWDSGGWQLAVPAGSYTVTFSDPALGSYSTSATMAADNVAIDARAVQFSAPLPVATLGADLSVGEAAVRLLFSVTLDQAPAASVSVHWSLADGTATVADGDMPAGQGGTLDFAAGQASAGFAVLVNDEAYKQEGSETFSVVLDAPLGMTLGRASASVTLLDDYVAPPAVALAMTDTTTKSASTPAMAKYAGPLSYLDQEFIYLGSDGVALSANAPNVFLRSGSGDDALAVTAGQNVLDGGTGSNFLTGGVGADTFFLDARGAAAAIWSTVEALGAGDAVTLWGVTPAGYALDWVEDAGAPGHTGLTMHATAAGKAAVSLTLVGMTDADRTGGRLSVLFGTDPGSGSDYMYVFANG